MRPLLLLCLLAACSDKAGDNPDDSGIPSSDDSSSSSDDSSATDDSADPLLCGNGALDQGEDCDDGESNGASTCGCQTDCSLPGPATSCDDGSLCTDQDACDSQGSCAGTPITCDDSDACTTDTCDEGTGQCVNAGFSGTARDLYDMDMLRDPTTLDLEVLSTSTTLEGLTLVEVSEVRYTSYESEGCELRPVRIEAYIAKPVNASGRIPGLVVAHGLGGNATAGAATNPAGELGVVALAYSGPGQGQSEGTGSTSDHLFDTATNPQNSWFWEHSVAAIRGLTVLENLPDVDPTRLGMTGFSGGGVATYMVNGVDDRLDVAVPVSATGYLDSAARATPNHGWEYDLLQAMSPPRTPDSIEWQNYVDYLDPKNFLPTSHADTLMIVGSQDEFFPIDSAVDTLNGIASSGRSVRLLSIKDWDHGWYALFNSEQPAIDAANSLNYFIKSRLGLDSSLAELAPQPQVDGLISWICFYGNFPYNCSAVQASLPTSTGYRVTEAKLHFSADGALTFATWNLQQSGSVWQAEVGTLDGTVYNSSNLVYFVEFTFQQGYFGPEFKLTSVPNIPAGFQPNIIPIDGPLQN